MGLNKFSGLLVRKRESYLSFEYNKLFNSSYNPQNLAMDQNLSSEDNLKVSELFSEGISLFFSIWEKDNKKMPIYITKDNYGERVLEKYNPAIECFDKVLGLDKENTQALEYKAHSLFLNGYFEEAIELYRIVSKKKNTASAWNDLGVALMEYGLSLNEWYMGELNLLAGDQLHEAIECFELAKDICSTLNLALLYRSMNNFFAASIYYNRALKIDKNNIAILINAAENYLLMDFFDESKKLYKKAIDIDPSFMEKYFDDGACSICSAGKDDLMFLKMGLELYPDIPSINSRFIDVALRNPSATGKIGRGLDDIFQCYNKLIELGGDDSVLLETVGMIFNYFPSYVSKEILESLDKIDLERIIETTAPSDLSYYGSILSNSGNDKEAKKFYEKSLKAIDKVLLKIKDNYYISRSDSIFRDKKDYDYYIRFLLEDKLSILMDIGMYEDAEKSLNQLKEYGLEESEYIYKMGLIYYKKAKKEKKKEQKHKYYTKAYVFFDDYLGSSREDTYTQMLRIDALSNYAERDIVLDSIRKLIKDENLEAKYYDDLLKAAFSLEAACKSEEFELCGKIFDKATTVIQGDDIKKISLSYAQIQKYIHSKDKEEKQKIKKELAKEKEKNIILMQKINRDNEHEAKSKKRHEENMEAHKKTHRGIEDIKNEIHKYNKKLEEIYELGLDIKETNKKVFNETSKFADSMKELHPDKYEEIKREIRRNLGI